MLVASSAAFAEAVSPDGSQQDDSFDVAHLLNLYASAGYFYSTNPSTISIRKLQVKGVSPGSHGYDFYGSVSSRKFNIMDQLGFGLGYAYSSTSFVRRQAKSLDSFDHDINAKLSYYPLSNLAFDITGDVRFNYFNKIRISTNYGGTLSTTWTIDENQSLSAHAGLMKERYSDVFNDQAGGSLRYQDAWNRSLGFGAYLVAPESGISLDFDYTFTDHRTEIRPQFKKLSKKARDGRYREHAAYADLRVPLRGFFSRLSLEGDINYSYRDYLNRQSGLLYRSVKRKFMKVIMLTSGVKVNAVLWEPAGLTLTIGVSETRSRSLSVESTYEDKKFYAQFSAYY